MGSHNRRSLEAGNSIRCNDSFYQRLHFTVRWLKFFAMFRHFLAWTRENRFQEFSRMLTARIYPLSRACSWKSRKTNKIRQYSRQHLQLEISRKYKKLCSRTWKILNLNHSKTNKKAKKFAHRKLRAHKI